MRLAALLFLALFVLACTGSSGSAGIAPITGILVRSETLVSGRGCGEDATKLYRYAAVVADDAGSGVVGGTYDCFADAAFTFGNFVPDGSKKYKVHVFAFNRPGYDAQNGSAGAIDKAGADLTLLRNLKSTWTTTCEATPLPNVQVLAVCPNLRSEGTASVALPTQRFPREGGGEVLCGSDFVKARAVIRGSGQSFEVDCPATVRAGGLAAPSEVQVDVDLVDRSAAAVFRGRCTARTSPGLEATVVCKAFSAP